MITKLVFSIVLSLFIGSLISCDDKEPEAVKSSEKRITSFMFSGLDPAVTGTIDETTKTIQATVPNGTGVSSLVPSITISAKAKIAAQSGIAQDFSQPKIYTVTAEDGSTARYTVTVTVEKNEEAKITSFSFKGINPVANGNIDATAKTISFSLPVGTNLKALIPTIEYSNGATVSPKSGVAQNFTNPLTYTVTSEKGNEVKYTVTASIDLSGKQINSFVFSTLNPVVTASIDETTKTISATVPYGTNISRLSPTIVVSAEASISPASGTVQDFTNPVEYIVTAGDKSTATYVVKLTVLPEIAITSVDKTTVARGGVLKITGIFGASGASGRMVTLKKSGATWTLSPKAQGWSSLTVIIDYEIEPGIYTLIVTSNGLEVSYPTLITITADVEPQPTLISLDKDGYVAGVDGFRLAGENLNTGGTAYVYLLKKGNGSDSGRYIFINEAGDNAVLSLIPSSFTPGEYVVFIIFGNGKSTNELTLKIITNTH